MSQILSMFALQQQLNDATNGIGWEAGITKQGKPIDWRRCIYLECAELIESYPWKHWKNIDAAADTENIKIEVVDIWHFVMSEILRLNANSQKLPMEELSAKISSLPSFGILREPASDISDKYFDQIAAIEKFLKCVFIDESLEELANLYFYVVFQSGLNLDSLYQLYIGKNILNQFRQDHGYKDGSYTKVWNGKEDNVVMQNLLAANPTIGPSELYDALKASYPKQ
ncbi:MAG: dUTP diphosphatase [Sulfurovaceae bacterium]|nr:dUTP diphosphatase [Sulfurovaceae bacterium]